MISSESQPNEVKAQTRGHKKKARTKQALIDAALEIYAQGGISDLTLNDLASRANVSNGTIYNYFKTREEVLEAVSIELANQFSDQITMMSQHITSGSVRTILGMRMFIQRALNDIDWAKALLHVIHFNSGMRSTVANAVRRDLNDGLKEGIFHIVDEEIALTMLVSSTIGVLISIVEGRYNQGDDLKLAEMLLKAFGVLPDQVAKIANMNIVESSLK
ncbi:TetR/AcrR family transcriptional regulator [bacterium SPL81]|nr:TetR/AcrR family transcriptional regulator [Acinetobacter baumannii]